MTKMTKMYVVPTLMHLTRYTSINTSMASTVFSDNLMIQLKAGVEWCQPIRVSFSFVFIDFDFSSFYFGVNNK